MKFVKQYWYFMVLIFALTVGYIFWSGRSIELEFKPYSAHEGFRELVLDNKSSSRADPFFLLRAKTKGDALERGRINACNALFRDPTSPTLGNHDAKVSIVEFFDYRCPYCKQLSILLKETKIADNRVRIIYKEWPILGESSELATRAALASVKQGKYLQVHDRLMTSGFVPTIGYIKGFVTALGLDLSLLRSDMDSSETTLTIQRNSALAAKLGFIGTPSLVVGRTIVQGAITRAQLESLIEIESSMELPPLC